LIDRVWDEAPAGARSGLYSYVARLRQVLAQARAADGEHLCVQYGSGGYLLDVDPERVDLHRFRRLLSQARGEVTDDADRAQLLAEAVAMWSGEPLADLSGRWVTQMRVTLVRQRLDAVVLWARVLLRGGRADAVIDCLRELLVKHPLEEQLIATLIEALYRDGRGAEALDCYAQARRRILEELGTEPGAHLRGVHEAVLRDDPGKFGVSPAAVSSGAALPPIPGQLPPDVAGFVGRAKQLGQLDRLSSTSDGDGSDGTAVPILLITGTPGVGKTALAVHWAHRRRDRYPDGQLYVDLRGYANSAPVRPLDALARFLSALGLTSERIPTDLDEATAIYRSLLVDKRVLVVLDNAANADQVRPLLPGAPECLVLVTSRDRTSGLVAYDGARCVDLEVLPLDEAQQLLVTIVGADRLAIGSATAARLAAACAYLPLALRMAAANLAHRSAEGIGDYLARLHTANWLAALEVPGDEYKAVRTAFDLSYAHLPADARRLFRRMGLVPGRDITSAAAAALMGVARPQVEPLLDRLADGHLLIESAPRRYTFHDLLREYAASRTAQDDTEQDRTQAVGRLYEHYLRTVDAAVALLSPGLLGLPRSPSGTPVEPVPLADRTEALNWLDTERPNLVAAVVAAAADHRPAAAAWQLADALRGYFHLRVPLVDWLTVAAAGLTAAEAEGDLTAQAAAELNFGDARDRQGQHSEAIEHYARALDLALHARWLPGQAASRRGAGFLQRYSSGRGAGLASVFR
jgi:DNA-binding SARP family transcriptional activator